ncbi:MAG: hypothetical protein U0802_00505 [Candidatus Binatia bacterium]
MADRVDDLLARMTLDEKLAQLGCVWSTQLVADEAFARPRPPADAARHRSDHPHRRLDWPAAGGERRLRQCHPALP